MPGSRGAELGVQGWCWQGQPGAGTVPPSWLPSPQQYTGEISTAFEKMNITLSPISLLNQTQRELLLNASWAAQPPDFTPTLEQVGWEHPGVGVGGTGCVLRGSVAPSPLLLWESCCRLPGCPLPPMSCLGATGHFLHLGCPGSTLPHRDGV